MTFVDTNVLLDVITGDPAWVDWSVAHLDNTRLHGPLFINDIVFAELAVRYERTHEVEALLAGMRLVHIPIPRDALFLAAKAFQRYKCRWHAQRSPARLFHRRTCSSRRRKIADA